MSSICGHFGLMIGVIDVVYDVDSVSLFSRMSVQPNNTRKAAINEFILSLKILTYGTN